MLTITRAMLKEYLRNAGAYDQVDSKAVRMVERCIEHGLKAVNRERYWSFLQDSINITTIPAYDPPITLIVADMPAVVAGVSTVPFTDVTVSAALPANIVGAYIQFEDQNQWYEIATRVNDLELTLRQPYQGEDLTTGKFAILYPNYDLPVNFRRHRDLIDLARRQSLRHVDKDQLLWQFNERAGASGSVWDFAIGPKRHDPNIMQIILYPPPGERQTLELVYWRDAGWYDTNVVATSNWKREATADTDYVDWPERFIDLLRYACLVAVWKERGDHQKMAMAMDTYRQLIDASMDDDEVQGEIRVIGQGARSRRPRWELR